MWLACSVTSRDITSRAFLARARSTRRGATSARQGRDRDSRAAVRAERSTTSRGGSAGAAREARREALEEMKGGLEEIKEDRTRRAAQPRVLAVRRVVPRRRAVRRVRQAVRAALPDGRAVRDAAAARRIRGGFVAAAPNAIKVQTSAAPVPTQAMTNAMSVLGFYMKTKIAAATKKYLPEGVREWLTKRYLRLYRSSQ